MRGCYDQGMTIESLLLTAVRINTFNGQQALTNASGFFFRRDSKLFLVTCRHVMIDEDSNHNPDNLQIEIHDDPDNLASSISFYIPLYHEGNSLWRQAFDHAGEVDVAAIELDQAALPEHMAYSAFTAEQLLQTDEQIQVGTSVMVVGFPLGFHDTLHHMPIARQGMIASSFGLRFQGQGFFLTDARTHRGISGAPVVMHRDNGTEDMPWRLLGIHSARLDVGTRDMELDEVLGLNCSWYADILLSLTET